MQKSRLFRATSLLLLMCFLLEIFTPTFLVALTGGAVQTDFMNSPGSSDMVDLFTGEFKYNLPLLTVPGPHGSSYPVTLSYKSNFSPEDDASWVGYGWSLNPGAVVRNKNGFADDWNNANVTYYNKMTPNETYSAGIYAGTEVFDKEIGLGGTVYVRHNNYTGWGLGMGFFSSIMGLANLGLNLDPSGTSFSVTTSPMSILQRYAVSNTSPDGLTDSPQTKLSKDLPGGLPGPTLGKTWNLSEPTSRPTQSYKYDGEAHTYSAGIHGTQVFLAGGSTGLTGSFTRITPQATNTKYCYGFMYSADARHKNSMMDYSVEKQKPFNINENKFLPIPFSAPDQFVATGEGVQGSFRIHHSRAGRFRPNYEYSKIDIFNFGLEVIAPAPSSGGAGSVGVSGQLQTGESSFTTQEWYANNPYYFHGLDSVGQDGEPYYFRFDNDMGGSKIYNWDHDKPTQAWGNSGVYDRRTLPPVMNYGERHNRNTYIGFRTIEQLNASASGVPYRSYNKESESREMVDRQNNGVAPNAKRAFSYSIGEIAIAGSNGNRHVYGLPVYSREEHLLNIGAENNTPISNYLIKDNNATLEKGAKIIGERQSMPYAAMYLLTETTTPDYFDVNNNGPDEQDIGGYTTFSYTQAYGSFNKIKNNNSDPNQRWYKWRSPYKGLRFNRNSLSDPRDDMGTVNYGEREVYYLKSIETKTHVAYFVTNKTDVSIGNVHLQGSDAPRLDGYEANRNESNAAGGSGAYPEASDANKMQYLEEIHLYAKDDQGLPGKLLKKVRFAYNYSLMKGGADLNSAPDTDHNHRHGKLTLRYVWVESEGVVNPRISPYEFIYEYPDPAMYPAPYSTSVAPPFFTGTEQNPPYTPTDIDRWGRYQKDGASRYNTDKTWVDQNPPSDFDPAAWHLKRIKLPSGAEIHIQYEQHEYEYVQNRPAMAMVALKAESSDNSSIGGYNKYYLDIAGSLGSATGDDITLLKQRIKQYFIQGSPHREKMYFKFKYKLYPEKGSEVCNHEYIRGYGRVYECSEDANGVYVRIGNDGPADQFPSPDLPRTVAYEYVDANHRGAFDDFSACDPQSMGRPSGSEESVLQQMANLAASNPTQFRADKSANRLPVLIPTESYLRIPLFKAKKGGGVRVKRLLSFNPDGSLESGDKVLYGSEYIYETFETSPDNKGDRRISSGVATNEPGQAREENSFVRLMTESDNETGGDVVAGERLIQHEGPLGESLLPGASIGYSRVIVRDIYTGVANPGFEVYDYHTVRDFPTIQAKISGVDKYYDPSNPIMDILQHSEETITSTQGYSFIRTKMHGVMRGSAKYAGTYTTSAANRNAAFAGTVVIGSTEYEYYKPGEEVPVMFAPDRPLRMRLPGKETEVVMEARSVIDLVDNIPAQYSLALRRDFPWVIGSYFPYFYYKRDEIHLHVTTQITDYPVILKTVTSYNEGVTSSSNNLVFDAVTGSPVITHTTDGYHQLDLQQSTDHNGSYYTCTLPAHMLYKDMGQRSRGENFIFHTVGKEHEWSMPYIGLDLTGSSQATDGRGTTAAGSCTFQYVPPAGASDNDKFIARNRLGYLLQALSPGDLVELQNVQFVNNRRQVTSRGIFYLGEITANSVGEATPAVTFSLFDPEFGSLTQGSPGSIVPVTNSQENINYLRVLRSGRDNTLGAFAGGITVYGTDVENAIQCAKDLRSRESIAHKLNNWVNAGRRSVHPIGDQELARLSLLNDHTFIWAPVNPVPNVSGSYDLVAHYSIPLNQPLPNNVICSAVEQQYPYLYCKDPLSVGSAHIASKFDWLLTKSGVIGDEWLTMGWWDNKLETWKNNEWLGGGTEECKQTLRYTGTEVFGINDDGDLVYYSHPYDGSQTSRNVNFAFRGSSGVAVLSRVNALPEQIFASVIAAGALTFAESWPNTEGTSNHNDYEVGRRGIWRAASAYSYKTNAVTQGSYDEATPPGPGNRANERNYLNAGTFTLPSLFNYISPLSSDPGWIRLSTIEQYTGFGAPVKVQDILGVSAGVIYEHHNKVVSMTAYNARVEEIAFESFEDQSGTDIDAGLGHTGHRCRRILSGLDYDTEEVTMTGPVSVRFWMRRGNVDSDVIVNKAGTMTTGAVDVEPLINNGTTHSMFYSVDKIARTGEWVLYEVVVHQGALGGSSSGTLRLRFTIFDSNTQYFIDDVRILPLYAIAQTSVYERNTMRPLATLDNEHFALLYQYSEEGRLLRSIKETIRGYKTVTDGIIHTPTETMLSVLMQNGHITSMAAGGGAGNGGNGFQLTVPNVESNTPTLNSAPATDGKFDLLDLHLSPDKKSLRIFGADPDSIRIPDAKNMKIPDAENIKMPDTTGHGLPTVKQLRKKGRDALQKQLPNSETVAPKADSTAKEALNGISYRRIVDSLNTRRNSTSIKK